MGKTADDAAGIGAADGEPDPDATADGDRDGDELSIVVGDADDGTDADGAARDDGGRTERSGRGTGRGSGGRAAGGRSGDVRSAGSRKRPASRKRKSSPATRTREASLKVDRKPAPRAGKATIPAEAFGHLAGVGFGIAAARRGPHWQLAAEEQRALGDAIAGVVKHVPLPEKELGVAADIATLVYAVYAIAQPRIEHDRRLALAAAGAHHAVTQPPPAAPPRVEDVGVQRMERVLRERLGGVPIDLRNPQHVALLNELADEGLIATGSAVGGGGQPQFTNTDPATNGAIVNDPNAVIEGLDPS